MEQPIAPIVTLTKPSTDGGKTTVIEQKNELTNDKHTADTSAIDNKPEPNRESPGYCIIPYPIASPPPREHSSSSQGSAPTADPPATSHAFNIERFKIGKALGRGRFGNVYMAQDNHTKKIVALKVGVGYCLRSTVIL